MCANHISFEISPDDLDNAVWTDCETYNVETYWSGELAERGRRFSFGIWWSDEHFYIRYIAEASDEPIVSKDPVIDAKTIGLWDRDVCEIFIAPDRDEPRRYFEFEVAPTGEWLDVAIDLTSGERISDWEYASGMQVSAKVEIDRIVMAIKIPFTAFGKTPERGDVWLGNVFRCVGTDPNRGYLAWSPTFTEVPSFHVPERFAELHFV